VELSNATTHQATDPDEDLLDALAELLLGSAPLPDDAAEVLNRHAWELYA
jgi:hypothetical protein